MRTLYLVSSMLQCNGTPRDATKSIAARGTCGHLLPHIRPVQHGGGHVGAEQRIHHPRAAWIRHVGLGKPVGTLGRASCGGSDFSYEEAVAICKTAVGTIKTGSIVHNATLGAALV